jgi:rhodanese-related sulfurtransferase
MKKISTDELKDMRDRGDDFALVNVLPAEKFAQTRIPGAMNIPFGDADFAARVEDETGGKEGTIVVYCTNMECPKSTRAAEALEAAGFTSVFDYKGGAEAWEEAVEGAASHL